jgi:hypothetical protein
MGHRESGPGRSFHRLPYRERGGGCPPGTRALSLLRRSSEIPCALRNKNEINNNNNNNYYYYVILGEIPLKYLVLCG